jgi:hypothetical protein
MASLGGAAQQAEAAACWLLQAPSPKRHLPVSCITCCSSQLASMLWP